MDIEQEEKVGLEAFQDDDLGDDSECGPDEKRDLVDDAIDGVIDLLIKAEYEEDSAIEATYDAMEILIGDGTMEDTPELDEPDDVKQAWIAHSIPALKAQLKVMGLEFEEN